MNLFVNETNLLPFVIQGVSIWFWCPFGHRRITAHLAPSTWWCSAALPIRLQSWNRPIIQQNDICYHHCHIYSKLNISQQIISMFALKKCLVIFIVSYMLTLYIWHSDFSTAFYISVLGVVAYFSVTFFYKEYFVDGSNCSSSIPLYNLLAH